jgi:hypothetical protein
MGLQKLPTASLDDINHRRRARETINQILDHTFDDSRVRTPAEVAAGLTPINPAYGPGDVRRYGAVLDRATDGAAALTRAIAQSVETGGAPVYIPGHLATGSAVVLLSGARIYGDGDGVSSIYALANTFSLLTDNNSAVTDIVIEDLLFEAVSIGTSNRGIFLDADTASLSERIRVRRCRFKTMFRGLNAHRASQVEFDDCVGEDLDSSLLYVGLSVAAGRSSKIRVRRPRVDDGDINEASGGGNIIIAYADGVRVENAELNDAGASSGSVNLHHGVYYRSVTRGQIIGTKATGHRRGAAIHVFSDTGETRCEDIDIRSTEAFQMQDYAAVRCHAVDQLTIDGVQAREGYTQALYLTDINRLHLVNVSGRNNNQEQLTGTQNAMCRLEDVVGANITNILGLEDSAGNGEYGQGCLFHLANDCSDIHWSNIHFAFPDNGAIGYYCIEVATSATLTRFSVNGITQNGASNAFHETGTGSEGSFAQIDLVNVGAADFLSLDQLHKFRCRDVWIEGVAWRYESNGKNIFTWLTSFPTSGNWNRDDTAWRIDSAASGTFGWRCVTTHSAGNGGTWKAMPALAA